jgi:hypothetical protein
MTTPSRIAQLNDQEQRKAEEIENLSKLFQAATSGERVRFMTALPVATTDLLDGEQAIILSGSVLESMIFENVSGVITYRGQVSHPIRSTAKSPADRAAISAVMSATDEYWYLMTVDDGASDVGWYRIKDGVQSGPYAPPGIGGALQGNFFSP